MEGEFELIDRIRTLFGPLTPAGWEGIGDDCAVVPAGDGTSWLLTTDLLVEGVHFLPSAEPAVCVGRKALGVNLSDVAAMGGRCVASLLSVALPAEARGAWFDDFIEGYRAVSERYGVALLGGDTTASKGGIAISVTAIGRAPDGSVKRRSAARPGDTIVVTGVLGASAAGLRDVMKGFPESTAARIHSDPTPRIEQGAWLGGRTEVHAMMDLSDGLASDLGHMLRASGVGAAVETERIPAYASVEEAVTGGEDYELLLTVEPAGCPALAADYRARFGEPLHVVGRIEEGAPAIRWLHEGRPIYPDWHGYDHFR